MPPVSVPDAQSWKNDKIASKWSNSLDTNYIYIFRCIVALGIDMATYIPILNDKICDSAKDSDTHVHLIKGFWKLKFWSKFSLYFRSQSFRQNRADSEKTFTWKLRHQYDLWKSYLGSLCLWYFPKKGMRGHKAWLKKNCLLLPEILNS